MHKDTMPSKNTIDEKIVKNVNFSEGEKKKHKKNIEEILEEDDDIEKKDLNEESSEDDNVDNNEDNDVDDEDDDDDDDDDEDDFGDGLTDVGLYNVLGNFFVDEEGNTIGQSLSNIVKELSKLNHTIKKYVSKN